MPGRAKASPVCSPDQPQDLEGSRGAKAGAVQEEPEGGGEGGAAAVADCEHSPNLGDPEIVKSPSDPKQYRFIAENTHFWGYEKGRVYCAPVISLEGHLH
ncbi:UNVERIFIED_CONTAM: hypothetical protein K2H54_054850, partial [Gekko kuhli]